MFYGGSDTQKMIANQQIVGEKSIEEGKDKKALSNAEEKAGVYIFSF